MITASAYSLVSEDGVSIPGNPNIFIMGRCDWTIQFDTDVVDGFKDFLLLFDTGMFLTATPPVLNGTQIKYASYKYDTTGVVPGGGPVAPLVQVSEALANFEVLIDYQTTQRVVYSGYFYASMDINNYNLLSTAGGTGETSITNEKRVLRASIFDSDNLQPSGSSIYNTSRSFCVFLNVSDLAGVVQESAQQKISAALGYFWNRGKGVAAPEFNLIEAKLFDETYTSEQTTLNTNSDTFVRMRISPATILNTTKVMLLKVSNSNTANHFYYDVIKGYGFIPNADPSFTTIDRGIASPSSKAPVTGANEIKFRIDKSYIVAGETYRLGVLSYHATGANPRGAFITDEFTTGESAPPAIYPDFVSEKINDAAKAINYGGDVISCVQMRLLSKFTVDKNTYTAKVVAAYGSGSYDTLLKKVVFSIIDSATNVVLYSIEGSDPAVVITTAPPNVSFETRFRLRHDEVASWADKSLILRWQQVFEYPTALTGLSEVHTDYINLDQVCFVRDYENNAAVPAILTTEMTLTTDTGDPLTTSCGQDSFKVHTQAPGHLGGAPHIAFIDRKFYSQANLQEEDGFVPPNGFAQLDSTLLTLADPAFVGDTAEFTVVGAALVQGAKYRVSAIGVF